MTDEPQRRPPTEEELAEAEEDIAYLKRELAKAETLPPLPVTSPGKFTEPIGLDADGNLQPPLTEEEKERKAEIRRRAVQRDQDE